MGLGIDSSFLLKNVLAVETVTRIFYLEGTLYTITYQLKDAVLVQSQAEDRQSWWKGLFLDTAYFTTF